MNAAAITDTRAVAHDMAVRAQRGLLWALGVSALVHFAFMLMQVGGSSFGWRVPASDVAPEASARMKARLAPRADSVPKEVMPLAATPSVSGTVSRVVPPNVTSVTVAVPPQIPRAEDLDTPKPKTESPVPPPPVERPLLTPPPAAKAELSAESKPEPAQPPKVAELVKPANADQKAPVPAPVAPQPLPPVAPTPVVEAPPPKPEIKEAAPEPKAITPPPAAQPAQPSAPVPASVATETAKAAPVPTPTAAPSLPAAAAPVTPATPTPPAPASTAAATPVVSSVPAVPVLTQAAPSTSTAAAPAAPAAAPATVGAAASANAPSAATGGGSMSAAGATGAPGARAVVSLPSARMGDGANAAAVAGAGNEKLPAFNLPPARVDGFDPYKSRAAVVRDAARELNNQRSMVPPSVAPSLSERERMAKNVDESWRIDCQEVNKAGVNLLAIPVQVLNQLREKGCRFR